jgi:hypothetical protein
MITLTVQIKSTSKGWVDQTIVTIMDDTNSTEFDAQVAQLKTELPVDYVARIKIENAGSISYTW